MENYSGDPNAMIKASNHAKYVKLVLPELRTIVGDSQVGGVVEEDLSDVAKAKKFANRNKIKLIYLQLGFVDFSLTGSTQTGEDQSGDFLPSQEGSELEITPKKDIVEELTTPGLTSTDQAIIDLVKESKEKKEKGMDLIGESDFADFYR
jgi:hypothetical protein